MPNAKTQLESATGQVLGIMGQAGHGKSQFAIQAPQPHAILCIDKPFIATLPLDFPGYDPALSFGKFYPPPKTKLDVEKVNEKGKPASPDKELLPPRNVWDAIVRDVRTIQDALASGAKEFSIGGETWPLPATVIVEGADFVRGHAADYILHLHNKYAMDDFLSRSNNPNPLMGWQLVARVMEDFYQQLTYLPGVRPVNVVITIGIKDETRTDKSGGMSEQVPTGNKVPGFGSTKQNLELPRQFVNLWMAEQVGNKFFMHTSSAGKAKHIGLRSGTAPGVLQPTEDVTFSKDVNHWNRLFNGSK